LDRQASFITSLSFFVGSEFAHPLALLDRRAGEVADQI
jgi:hypothetical protein